MTVNHDDLQRSLGRVEGNQGAMEARMDRFEGLVSDGFEKVETALERINNRLAAIEEREHQRKGAWAAIITACPFLGGFGAWIFQHFTK